MLNKQNLTRASTFASNVTQHGIAQWALPTSGTCLLSLLHSNYTGGLFHFRHSYLVLALGLLHLLFSLPRAVWLTLS